MNSLGAILRELAGLFVDDGALALEIVAIIAVAGICSIWLPQLRLVAGAVLLFGCLAMLFVNVVRTSRS